MSYSIALWDPSLHQPVPTTFDEATAMYRKLAGVDDEPNYWFVSFAQRIQDHVRLSPNQDETLLGYYGKFVETAQCHTGALFLVELPTEERIPLLRLMVATATALNLVVYDDGSGLAFLPGGKVLPEENAYIWETIQEELDKPSDFPRTKAEFKKMADPVFAELFGRYGFKWGKDRRGGPALVREFSGGGQHIPMSYEKLKEGRPGYDVCVAVYVYFGAVNEVYKKFDFIESSVVFGLDLQSLCGWGEHATEVSSRAEFEVLCPAIVNGLIELLEIAKDIDGLDQVMNGGAAERVKNILRESVYIPHCLIVARLAGNPNFERLAAELSDAAAKFWGGSGPNHTAKRNEFARLVTYLREEVKPLV